MNKIKILVSITIPIIFNKFISLSEMLYYTELQSHLADIIVVIGVIGILFCQTVGAYTLLTYLEKKEII